jgi:hypothetical protein
VSAQLRAACIWERDLGTESEDPVEAPPFGKVFGELLDQSGPATGIGVRAIKRDPRLGVIFMPAQIDR